MVEIREKLDLLRGSLLEFESIPFVIHSADKMLQIFHVSAALCQHLGYSRDQLILRSISLLESDDEVNGIEIAVRCGQELLVDDVEVRHCNGGIIQTRTHLIPVAGLSSKMGLFIRIYSPTTEKPKIDDSETSSIDTATSSGILNDPRYTLLDLLTQERQPFVDLTSSSILSESSNPVPPPPSPLTHSPISTITISSSGTTSDGTTDKKD